nr:hypothetical protein [Methylomarinum sp. Ch1-1]MDP4522269.1 hypothetical protein [Methylomarinum sp. Ch1-1]
MSPQQMKAVLDEIAKKIPKEIHIEHIYDGKEDPCNDAYLTYQAAGILGMDLALQGKREFAQNLIDSNLYQLSKKN